MTFFPCFSAFLFALFSPQENLELSVSSFHFDIFMVKRYENSSVHAIDMGIVGSVVECSPATRAARVRFPDDATFCS